MIATPLSIMMRSERYALLPDAEKLDVEARLSLCLRLDTATNKKQAFLNESLRTHNGRALSEGAIRKLYYDKWVATGRDWECLINLARCPQDAAGLPPRAVEYWHQLCHNHGGDRRHKAAHRELAVDAGAAAHHLGLLELGGLDHLRVLLRRARRSARGTPRSRRLPASSRSVDGCRSVRWASASRAEGRRCPRRS